MRRIGFYLFIMAVFLLAPLLALPQKAVPAPAAAPTPTPTAVARAAAPYRAVWVSYLEWEQVDFSSAEAFTQAIGTMLDNIQSIGATVVLAQVRPFGDALYPSDYFPFSHLCTGTQGQDPGFDPLALLVDAAHARDLQLEAWVNPYRIQAGQTPALCGASPARLHQDWVRYTDTGAYLDPASADVRQYIADGVGELCARYAVDGIHFDDYFYPTTDPSIDAADYAASGSTLTQDDWRRENVNALMELCHAAARRYGVRFGARPGGRPGAELHPAIQRRGPLAAAGDCGLPDAPALLGAGIYKKRRCVAQFCAAGRRVGRTAPRGGREAVRRAGGLPRRRRGWVRCRLRVVFRPCAGRPACFACPLRGAGRGALPLRQPVCQFRRPGAGGK